VTSLLKNAGETWPWYFPYGNRTDRLTADRTAPHRSPGHLFLFFVYLAACVTLPLTYFLVTLSSSLQFTVPALPPPATYVTFVRSRYSELIWIHTPVVYTVTHRSRRVWQSVLDWWPQISDSLSTCTSKLSLGVFQESCAMWPELEADHPSSDCRSVPPMRSRSFPLVEVLPYACLKQCHLFMVQLLLRWFMSLGRSFLRWLYLLYCRGHSDLNVWVVFLTSWLLFIVCPATSWGCLGVRDVGSVWLEGCSEETWISFLSLQFESNFFTSITWKETWSCCSLHLDKMYILYQICLCSVVI